MLVSGKLPLQLPFFGRLPGDQPLERTRYTLFLPIATMALLNLVITVVANVVFRFFR
jgi:hypothetical protein